jgi:hypothetical protein
MSSRRLDKWYFIGRIVSLFSMALLLSSPVAAESGQFVVSPVAEKKLNGLPAGPLYWRIENFPALEQAQGAAAASPTSLAAAVSGRVWLFTLGQKGGMTPGSTKVAEIGPVPVFAAPAYKQRDRDDHITRTNRVALTKIALSQNTIITRKGVGIERPVCVNNRSRTWSADGQMRHAEKLSAGSATRLMFSSRCRFEFDCPLPHG